MSGVEKDGSMEPLAVSPGSTRLNEKFLFGATLFVLLSGYWFVADLSWKGSSEAHTLMEAVASVVALLTGVLALVRFYSKKDNTFLFVAVGFLGTALLDGYHAVVTSSFFAQWSPSSLESLIPWSWVASRLYLSLCLMVSWLAWHRENRWGEQGRLSEQRVYALGLVLTLGSFFVFSLVPLPRAYYSVLFFSRPEELLPAALFLIALIGYVKKGQWRTDSFEAWLILSLLLSVACQALYMSQSKMLFDGMFDVAHLLKILSYGLVFTGLLWSVFETYRLIIQTTEAMHASNRELHAEIAQRLGAETKSKQSEEDLVDANKALATSNQELEQFAFIASHDLQEPLRKISSFCQLLKKENGHQLDQEGKEYLDVAIQGAERLRTLVQNLLTFSRITTRGHSLVPTSANACLQNAISNLEIAVDENKALVTYDALPTVMADESQFVHLFQNLLGNALKYHSDRSPEIHVGGCRRGKEFEFFVRDNGIGVEAEFHEKIFGIFRRLHNRREYTGTGIGLALCKRIVERFGGRIWIDSTLGAGSTFYFTMKLAEPQGGNDVDSRELARAGTSH